MRVISQIDDARINTHKNDDNTKITFHTRLRV